MQQVPALGLVRVEQQVVHPAQQAAYDELVELVGHDGGPQPLGHQGAVAVVVDLGPGDPDEPGVGGQLALALALVEGGQQLAQSEVTDAAEDGEVAGRQAVGQLGGGESPGKASPTSVLSKQYLGPFKDKTSPFDSGSPSGPA